MSEVTSLNNEVAYLQQQTLNRNNCSISLYLAENVLIRTRKFNEMEKYFSTDWETVADFFKGQSYHEWQYGQVGP